MFLHRLARLPNAWLLLALVLQVLLYPLVQPMPAGHAAMAAWDLVVLVLALRAARASGPEARLGYLLVLPAIVLHVAAAFLPDPTLLLASYASQAAFHGFVVSCLLRYMLRDDVMTLDELFAAAGLYVLVAFCFAFLYAALELLAPGSFAAGAADAADGQLGWFILLYFSFTCLTSVGFGDITPATDGARSLVMIEQMLGVLYLALMISRLVALQAARRRPPG